MVKRLTAAARRRLLNLALLSGEFALKQFVQAFLAVLAGAAAGAMLHHLSR